jgi:DNA-binding response OmpR family regulator
LIDAARTGLDLDDVLFLKGADEQRMLVRIDQILNKRAALAVPHAARRKAASPLDKHVVIDRLRRRVWIDGREVPHIAARRFDLMCLLVDHSEPLSREALLDALWAHSDNKNLIDVTLHRLRQDLAAFPSLRIEATPRGFRLTVPE